MAGISGKPSGLPPTGAASREFRKHRRGSRDSVLPPSYKNHLNSLFREIEDEFSQLYLENVRLKEQVEMLEKSNPDKHEEDTDGFDINVIKSFTKKNFPKTRHKLKAQTSKIVSSFKTSAITCSFVREFKGHRDGIWDISVSCLNSPLVGTASADRTAGIWAADTGKCLLRYHGHQGSVNSIKFHPSQDLVVTGSGDGTAHVWNAAALPEPNLGRLHSSEESADSSDDGVDQGTGGGGEKAMRGYAISMPLVILQGHQGVVSCADWMAGGEQVVTASWDRTASIWDVSCQTVLHSLAGHDMELTGASCHPTNRLVVTSSKDSTFRLWDFREAIHSVSVFQGHTDAVSCAVFSQTEHIVSGSDDRTVKVWDLRNMRAPLTNIQTDSQVNKVAVSSNGIIAIPQDNRHVLLFDVTGVKLSRLPRDAAKCHMRMVSSAAWPAGDPTIGETGTSGLSGGGGGSGGWRCHANLFTAGFDRMAYGWRVKCKGEEGTNYVPAKAKLKEGTVY